MKHIPTSVYGGRRSKVVIRGGGSGYSPTAKIDAVLDRAAVQRREAEQKRLRQVEASLRVLAPVLAEFRRSKSSRAADQALTEMKRLTDLGVREQDVLLLRRARSIMGPYLKEKKESRQRAAEEKRNARVRLGVQRILAKLATEKSRTASRQTTEITK